MPHQAAEPQAAHEDSLQNEGTLTNPKRQEECLVIVHKAHTTKSRGQITWNLWLHTKLPESTLVPVKDSNCNPFVQNDSNLIPTA